VPQNYYPLQRVVILRPGLSRVDSFSEFDKLISKKDQKF